MTKRIVSKIEDAEVGKTGHDDEVHVPVGNGWAYVAMLMMTPIALESGSECGKADGVLGTDGNFITIASSPTSLK
jgi:hypothetical protein